MSRYSKPAQAEQAGILTRPIRARRFRLCLLRISGNVGKLTRRSARIAGRFDHVKQLVLLALPFQVPFQMPHTDKEFI